MKLEKLSIICATLTCLLLTSNVLAEERQSFIRKVRGGGFVSEIIQMKDGSYAYLNGHNITKVKDLSGKTISEVALTLVDISGGFNAMAQTSDGFVLVGSAGDYYYGDLEGLVVKVSMQGRVVWKKLISVNDNLVFDSVFPTVDRGFIVTGRMYGNIHPILIKFSSSGDVLWSISFDTLSSNRYSLSAPTMDGGVFLGADRWNADGSIGTDVIKIDGSGKLVWAVTLEMKEFLLEEVNTLSDEGYLIAGKTGDSSKLLLVRLNADGTIHSKAAYSLDVPDFSVSYLAQTPESGIAISGTLWKKTSAYYDTFLLKINLRQELTLQKRLGFPDTQKSNTTVIPKEDGSYLLFGSTYGGVSADTLFVGISSDGLGPGCGFSHNLNASKVLFGNLNFKRLTITPSNFVVTTNGSLEIRSKRLNRKISNSCAK